MCKDGLTRFFFLPGVVLGLLFLFSAGTSVGASAQVKDYTFENIEVVFDINEDSTMDVTEKITYKFTGEFSVLERGIILEDQVSLQSCKSNPSLQCGGFDAIQILGGSIAGKGITTSETHAKQFSVSDLDLFTGFDYSYNTVQYIEYDFGKTQFDGDLVVWELKYKIYGGLGFFENEDYDLFYWDTLPPDRTKAFLNASVKVNFPKIIDLDADDIAVYGFERNYDYEIFSTSVEFIVKDIDSYEDFTVLIKFPRGVVTEPGKIELQLDPITQNVKYLEVEREVRDGDVIYGLPAETYDMEFSAPGYQKEIVSVQNKSGEMIQLEVGLEQSVWASAANVAGIILNLCACLMIPIVAFGVFGYWYRKGRDLGGRKTIVPWFKPPEGMAPYLLGSIKDERVDPVDISATLIDVAYRGFIRIKEISKKKYEFIKLHSFDSKVKGNELNAIEQKIMKAIFDGKDKVTTSDIKKRFYKETPKLKKAIYQEMVDLGFFDKSPEKVRNNWIGCGCVSGIVGVVLFIVMLVVVTPFLLVYGIVAPFTIPLILIAFASAVIIISQYMPAKTNKGTLVYEQAKGFKMFLHTADRYRMQKQAPEFLKHLTPENFEKYLSYAIVFGVEKEWAKAFADIYKGQPDWYEGDYRTFSTIYLASSLSRMNKSTTTAMTHNPNSNSSGGWSSGGGGFSGGFSGGGGGGGSIGAR